MSIVQSSFSLKTGNECFINSDNKLPYTLLDFWRWNNSDLLSNAARGRLAEFIVAIALGVDIQLLRSERDAYDLLTPTGIKVEVKSSAYIQSWKQEKYSHISFSIRPARFWNEETNKLEGEYKRHADVYIFCHLKHKDPETINPLDVNQRDFYLIPTHTINQLKSSQKTISLSALQQIVSATTFDNIQIVFSTLSLKNKN